MRKFFLFTLLLFFALPATAVEIHLSAAVSLGDALKDLCATFERNHSGAYCLANFGASGTLAKQIAEGAPTDLFVSASSEWMDYLEGKGKIAAGTRRSLAANTLVFIGPASTRATSLEELATLERVAIGSPRSVPAGRYAEQALQAAGIYSRLLTEGRLVMAQDARQALVYADRGEVDGALVYRTDALLAKKTKIIFAVPGELHDPVTYPIALTVRGAKKPEAVSFYHFLQTSEAKKILSRYGFLVN